MRSLIGWVGGKRLLAPTIVALFPEHDCYVEVFGGAASVLFAKEPGGNEVYNDLDSDLVNLFLCVREHPDEFCKQVEGLLLSREIFDKFGEQPGLTDIQRAVRFFYLVKVSFNKLRAHFGYSRGATGIRFLPERIKAAVALVQDRLQRVAVEHADFEVVLARYDAARTLFYVDPPWTGAEGQYAVPFAKHDHERLRDALGQLSGKWLLTYGDQPWVRKAYASFHLYGAAHKFSNRVAHGPRETSALIITNYRPTRAQLKAAPKKLTLLRKSRRKERPTGPK